MARIRIVDDWLRSPASAPTHYRSIMVVSDSWAEQRVLMRAYAESGDQTRPTIVLHGMELAIGPAGIDPHGNWGIHVQPPVDGRAQELKDQLELAARRLAGTTKASPPRLADEMSPFDRKRTNNWAPGAPRDVPGAAPPQGYYEPQAAANASQHAALAFAPTDSPEAQFLPQQAPAQVVSAQPAAQVVASQAPAQMVGPYTPSHGAVASAPISAGSGGERMTPVPMQAPGSGGRRRGWTSPRPVAADDVSPARTALGYDSGAGAQNAVIRLGLRPAVAATLARLIDRTVPADFTITPHEREVINAIGEAGQLSARQIGTMLGVADPVAWMERLVDKLVAHGLDLVGPGTPAGGEPTYTLRR